MSLLAVPSYNLDAADKHIRTRKIARVSDNLVYVGESMQAEADPAEPGWRIRRIMVDGNETTEDVAESNQFVCIWDNRTDYFQPPTPVFSNEKSLLFDGVNDYVNFSNVNNFQRTDAFSFSLWCRPTSTTAISWIIGHATGTTGIGWYLTHPTANSGKLRFNLTSVNNTNEIEVETPSAVLQTNTWKHVVVTYDGSSLASGVVMYINGVSTALSVLVNNLTGSTQANNVNMTIGATNNVATFWPGYIDEVSIFNRVLTAPEVSTMYNSGKPTDLSGMSGIVNWWRMGDGDTYPVIIDRIGAYNGAMLNMSAASITSVVP